MKKLLALVLALVLSLTCVLALAEEEEEENYETGDATLDLVRNEDEIGEKELLVISFGTSFNDSRRLTIGGIEGAIAEAIPDYSVRRGFTAQIIIDHIDRRDHIHIDNVTEALDRAVANGVKILVVQPTHLMHGFEYDEMVETLAGYADAFEQVVVGEPLLSSDEDFDRVADILIDITKAYDDGKTAIVYMGHGTEHEYNRVYARMQDVLTAKGAENYYVGTVEAEPSLEDVVAAIADKGYTRVVLRPMMVVAGDHANNDMAGDEEDSWKTVLTEAGYEVECVLEGLGQVPEIQAIYAEHAQAAAAQAENPVSHRVAAASDMTDVIEMTGTNKTPVTAEMLNEGVYSITVDSSSSMFRVVGCDLLVLNGVLTAQLRMKSDSYSYMYAGSAEEAAKAEEDDLIPLDYTQNGEPCFRLPVDALDAAYECAAYSARKELWYPRTLVFRSDSLPQSAWKEE